MNDTNNDDDTGLMARIKESPRTVSALIIILIVAAAIYAFSADETVPTTSTGDEVAIDTSTDEAMDELEATPGVPAATAAATPAVSRTPVSQDKIAEEIKQFPEPRKTEAGYVEVAQAGDGITHLSRRAVTRYLSENQTDFAVTNEHRIYIEDYIQNRLGSKGLSLGEEQTVSYDLLREAINAAKSLNDPQLRNLSQYTHVLT